MIVARAEEADEVAKLVGGTVVHRNASLGLVVVDGAR